MVCFSIAGDKVQAVAVFGINIQARANEFLGRSPGTPLLCI